MSPCPFLRDNIHFPRPARVYLAKNTLGHMPTHKKSLVQDNARCFQQALLFSSFPSIPNFSTVLSPVKG